MAKKIKQLSEAEIDIFNRGVADPNVTLSYLFSRPGRENGFQFDHNFTERGKWQKKFCMASQTFIVVIGGIGTGKTLAAGMSGFYHCVQTTGFKFLNIAREAWQSQLMYQLILENAEGTPAEDFIVSSPKRPYPMIQIEYMVGDFKNKCTMEFMSLGEGGDATNVFSWRGDMINIDEAGRIENLAEVVSNLSTRLTGNTPSGRPYMGRLQLTTNPWDNPELWEMWDMAEADKESGLAIECLTEDNKNVTEKQLTNMLKLIPESERARFTSGKRPQGRGTYFPKADVERCEDETLSELLLQNVKDKKPGWILEHLPRTGYWHFQMPPTDGRVYFLVGDPGTGEPPHRNAPCWLVFDVTDAPTLSTIRAMWWGFGHGSITPFVSKGLDLLKTYRPILAGVDNTSNQKNTAEIVNIEYVTGQGYSVDKFIGFDFSGGRRYSYLLCAKLGVENVQIKWPSIIRPISSQLENYDPKLDRGALARLANDITATFSMGAYAIRANYVEAHQEDGDAGILSLSDPSFGRRYYREVAATLRDQRRASFRPSRRTLG